MRKIAMISDFIRDEIEGAEEYAETALEYKALDKPLADAAYTAATQELAHVDMWHTQVVRMIKEHQATGKETPAGMMDVYEWQHKKQIDAVTRIKLMLEQYKK